jgi:hypothetical protein
VLSERRCTHCGVQLPEREPGESATDDLVAEMLAQETFTEQETSTQEVRSVVFCVKCDSCGHRNWLT